MTTNELYVSFRKNIENWRKNKRKGVIDVEEDVYEINKEVKGNGGK